MKIMKVERVEEILRRFPSKRILVIGDVMLDEFVWGRVSRISPEAPVPVVDIIRESYFPGGAAGQGTIGGVQSAPRRVLSTTDASSLFNVEASAVGPAEASGRDGF